MRFLQYVRLGPSDTVSVDLFNGSSALEIISNLIVYEDEDVREDGLKVLGNLVTSELEMMAPVTTVLLASVESGFSHEPQQRLRTLAFVQAIVNGGYLSTSVISMLTNTFFQTTRVRSSLLSTNSSQA